MSIPVGRARSNAFSPPPVENFSPSSASSPPQTAPLPKGTGLDENQTLNRVRNGQIVPTPTNKLASQALGQAKPLVYLPGSGRRPPPQAAPSSTSAPKPVVENKTYDEEVAELDKVEIGPIKDPKVMGKNRTAHAQMEKFRTQWSARIFSSPKDPTGKDMTLAYIAPRFGTAVAPGRIMIISNVNHAYTKNEEAGVIGNVLVKRLDGSLNAYLEVYKVKCSYKGKEGGQDKFEYSLEFDHILQSSDRKMVESGKNKEKIPQYTWTNEKTDPTPAQIATMQNHGLNSERLKELNGQNEGGKKPNDLDSLFQAAFSTESKNIQAERAKKENSSGEVNVSETFLH